MGIYSTCLFSSVCRSAALPRVAEFRAQSVPLQAQGSCGIGQLLDPILLMCICTNGGLLDPILSTCGSPPSASSRITTSIISSYTSRSGSSNQATTTTAGTVSCGIGLVLDPVLQVCICANGGLLDPVLGTCGSPSSSSSNRATTVVLSSSTGSIRLLKPGDNDDNNYRQLWYRPDP